MFGVSVKGQYLRAKWMLSAVARNSYPILARQGAYLRGIARRLIRRRKSRLKIVEVRGVPIYVELNASQPGQPPFTHRAAGQRGLKDSILFAVGRESVLIGPAASVIGRIGHTHEFGGTEPAIPGRPKNANWKLEIGGHGPIRISGGSPVFARLFTDAQVARAIALGSQLRAAVGFTMAKPRRKYPPRPFMGPALQIAAARLPAFWANALTRAA